MVGGGGAGVGEHPGGGGGCRDKDGQSIRVSVACYIPKLCTGNIMKKGTGVVVEWTCVASLFTYKYTKGGQGGGVVIVTCVQK